MSDAVIRVEGLGKRYRISPVRRADAGWRGRLPWLRGRCHDLWALRDVSFSVDAGEVVGVIGRNGAGKSTLLKVLSGITNPTAGRALLRGRLASLLEVGTGFHPDLTGRENVYLNGALLGMNRAEIRRKFDQIVDFAEVEEFLDTPIKRFSTGMQMRLAFAVAAHLDSEILIVDEALSVGDAAFQAKCVEATSEARQRGRTVLVVSHNMAVLRGWASRVLLLDEGRLKEDGSLPEVLSRYLTASRDAAEVDLSGHVHRDGSGEARFESLVMFGPHGEPTNHTYVGGPFHTRLYVTLARPIVEPQIGLRLHSSEGEVLVDLQARHDGVSLGRASGQYAIDVRVDTLCMYPGRYPISIWITDGAMGRTIDHAKLCATLVVEPGDPSGRGVPLDPKNGLFFVQSRWNVQPAPAPLVCVGACA